MKNLIIALVVVFVLLIIFGVVAVVLMQPAEAPAPAPVAPKMVEIPVAKVPEFKPETNFSSPEPTFETPAVEIKPDIPKPKLETKAVNQVEQLVGKKIALRGGNQNKYCAAEHGNFACNRDRVGSWETLNIEKSGDKYGISVNRDDGKFYCGEQTDGRLTCNATWFKPWEQHTMAYEDGHLVIKGGNNGKYCADEVNQTMCNRDAVSTWEKYKVEFL